GGGHFPNLDGSTIVLSPQAQNRQIIIDYIQDNGTIDPSADGNWSFAPIDGNPKLTFQSSPKAQQFIKQDGDISYVGEGSNGFAKYALDLSKPSLAALSRQLSGFIQSGDIDHPLAAQLTNKLKQARHQMDKGHQKQAVKKMQGFLKHLNNKAMAKFITAEAKAALNDAADELLDSWR
ncbi:MAG TPA: hypothetical protein VFK27_04375, partial [Bacillales bacterium]|nr:hypothetical protein [Bacillales bacterium]